MIQQMKRLLVQIRCPLIIVAAAVACATVSSRAAAQSCLPSDVKPTEIVAPDSDHQDRATKPKTVRDRLRELKARCRKGRLTDSRGKEIYFVRLIGCWGNPPADYEEQIEEQRAQVRELQKKYTVIQIPCVANPLIQETSKNGGVPNSISFAVLCEILGALCGSRMFG
jgi:hypothetical protein